MRGKPLLVQAIDHSKEMNEIIKYENRAFLICDLFSMFIIEMFMNNLSKQIIEDEVV